MAETTERPRLRRRYDDEVRQQSDYFEEEVVRIVGGGDSGAALAQFERAQQADPGFAPAAHHRADVLRELGRGAEAARRLGDPCPAEPRARKRLATRHGREGS